MEIYFELKDSQEILIKCKEKIIGRIFTPSGSSGNSLNAIQVCGFDKAFDLWGCGVFANKKGKRKQDIQLMFNEDSQNDTHSCRLVGMGDAKCYNEPCSCNELVVVREKELPIQKLTTDGAVSMAYDESLKLLGEKAGSK